MNMHNMALLMDMLFMELNMNMFYMDLLMNLLYMLFLMNMFHKMLWYQLMSPWCQLRHDLTGLTYLMEKLDMEKCVAEYMRCRFCFHRGH